MHNFYTQIQLIFTNFYTHRSNQIQILHPLLPNKPNQSNYSYNLQHKQKIKSKSKWSNSAHQLQGNPSHQWKEKCHKMYAQVSNLIYQKRSNYSFLPLSSLICTTWSRKLDHPRRKLGEDVTVESLFGQTLELLRSLSRGLVRRRLLFLSLDFSLFTHS